MESRPFPLIPCAVCSKPIDLQTDLCADEIGKAIHEECYVSRLLAAPSTFPIADKLFDLVSNRLHFKGVHDRETNCYHVGNGGKDHQVPISE